MDGSYISDEQKLKENAKNRGLPSILFAKLSDVIAYSRRYLTLIKEIRYYLKKREQLDNNNGCLSVSLPR